MIYKAKTEALASIDNGSLLCVLSMFLMPKLMNFNQVGRQKAAH